MRELAPARSGLPDPGRAPAGPGVRSGQPAALGVPAKPGVPGVPAKPAERWDRPGAAAEPAARGPAAVLVQLGVPAARSDRLAAVPVQRGPQAPER